MWYKITTIIPKVLDIIPKVAKRYPRVAIQKQFPWGDLGIVILDKLIYTLPSDQTE